MRNWMLVVAAGVSVAVPVAMPAAAVAAQAEAKAATAKLDPRAVVDEVRRIIAKRYVLAETRPALDAVLAKGLASGRYNVTDPATLADLVNADLEEIGRDRHLGFTLDPEEARTVAAWQTQAEPDDDGELKQQARAVNYGINELRILPGNVRYMTYNGGLWSGPESVAALETAMRFLAEGDAIIVDLRGNGGGDADAAKYVLSHFLPPNQQLYTIYEENQVKRVKTLAKVPTGRMIGKPIYVLISPNTASAAEEFAGNVAGFRLGEVIGEKTAGAGFMNDLVPIDGRFVLSISIARVVLASTGRDWERTGISPTIATPAAQALDTAQAHILRKLASTAPAGQRATLEALAEGLDARINARSAALPLPAYAGTFGERSVIAEGGKLYYQRGGGPRRVLIPLGGNRFAFDHSPGEHVEFAVSGDKASQLAVNRADKSVQGTYPRTS